MFSSGETRGIDGPSPKGHLFFYRSEKYYFLVKLHQFEQPANQKKLDFDDFDHFFDIFDHFGEDFGRDPGN